MEWRLFADLAERAGRRRVPVAVESATTGTVEDALAALFESHPELRERVLDGGTVRDSITVLRDGEPVAPDAALDGAEELALLPPASGG